MVFYRSYRSVLVRISRCSCRKITGAVRLVNDYQPPEVLTHNSKKYLRAQKKSKREHFSHLPYNHSKVHSQTAFDNVTLRFAGTVGSFMPSLDSTMLIKLSACSLPDWQLTTALIFCVF